MPLREIGEFHEWIRREQPSVRAVSSARTFIAELGDEPWRSPIRSIASRSHRSIATIRQFPIG